MNTEQLRNFAVAYRTHNFAAAARTIPMSAQGFTKSIRTLEAELGATLFKHNEQTGAQEPTRYADEFIGCVNDIESHLRIVHKSFRRIDAELGQRVNLGSSLGIMGLLGGGFVSAFKAAYPDITLTYTELNDAQCDEQLADETFGVAFTLAPFNTAFETVELYSTPVCLWVHDDDPLSTKDSIRIADLDGRALAMPGPEFKCRENILSRCRKEGIEPDTILASSEMFWLYNFAYEKRGLAFSAGHLGKLPFFAEGPVRCIPLEDVAWTFGISTLPKHRYSEAERLFRKFCLPYFKKRFGVPETSKTSPATTPSE